MGYVSHSLQIAAPCSWSLGLAGCGKTILRSVIITIAAALTNISSTALEDVQAHCRGLTSSLVGYFYFDFNDINKRLSQKLVRTLLFQFSSQNSFCYNSLRNLHSTCHNGQVEPKDNAMESLLHGIIEAAGTVFIIIDALDECADCDDLINLILVLMRRHKNNLHILFTSRPEREIVEGLLPEVAFEIGIVSGAVEQDIGLYVKNRLKNDGKLRKWPDRLQQEIRESLMNNAKGMCVTHN